MPTLQDPFFMDKNTIFSYGTSNGQTEGYTKLKDWVTLKAGQTILQRRSLIKRKILEANDGIIVLQKILGYGTTVYVPCDRSSFIIPPQ